MKDCLDLMHRQEQRSSTQLTSTFEAWRDTEIRSCFTSSRRGLNDYLACARRPGEIAGRLHRVQQAHRAQEMPYFQQELMEQAQAKGTLEDKAYRDALKKNRKLAAHEGIDEIVKKHKLDAIVGPTAGPAFVTDLVNGDRIDSGCASPPAVAGYPHVTVPAGYEFGLPVGISFFGRAWTEPQLIRYAYAFEQIRKARRKPEFRAVAELNA